MFSPVLSLSGIVSVVFFVGTLFFSGYIMRFFTNEPELVRMGPNT